MKENGIKISSADYHDFQRRVDQDLNYEIDYKEYIDITELPMKNYNKEDEVSGKGVNKS